VSFQPPFSHKPLKELSYYNTGGKCLGVIAPRSTTETKDAILWIQRKAKPFFVLGGGTNSLVSDEDFDGYVLSFHRMNELSVSREIINVQAGVINSDLVSSAYRHGLGGLGWMNRLPGQIGGTVRMNARCYGGEISNHVLSVTVVTKGGEIKSYNNSGQLFKGYKDTVFMDNGDLITEVTIGLEKVSDLELKKTKEKMEFCEQDRISKGQFLHPTCGCIFKNNYNPKVSVSSGFLLEQAGSKAIKYGGAEVSGGHSNFVYNKSATSGDVLQASFMMREAVYQKFGVWLDYEMEILGSLNPEQEKKFMEEKPFTSDPDKLRVLAEARNLFQNKLKSK
jgi:UDP-N-acetylmuramate dehydrogenase